MPSSSRSEGFIYLLLFSLADSRNTSLTESETDSDVLFETRTKSNGLGKHKSHNSHSHGHGSSGGSGSSGRDGHKYGTQKLGRKIKA